MNPFGTLLGLALSLLLGGLVFAVTAVFDRQALLRAQDNRLQLSLLVQAEGFRGNLEKHRQGAVLAARHPAMSDLVVDPTNRQSQRVAKQLYALTDLDGLFILGADRALILAEPGHVQAPSENQDFIAALDFAFNGSLGRALVGTDYLYAAPIFRARRVIGVAVSRFDLGEATASLALSTDEVRLLNLEGRELYSNRREGRGQRRFSLPLPDLSLVMVGHSGTAITARDWAGRGLGLGALAFAFGLLIAQLYARRRAALETVRRGAEQARLLEVKVAERTRELEDAQASVVQAGKLALLGQVAASISHEINQPLGAIRNYAENASAFIERDAPERARDNLSRIVAQTDRVSRIVGNLRSFVTGKGPAVRPVRLGPVIEAARNGLVSRFPAAGTAVALEADAGLRVVAGAVRLEQVLYNLLVNAWLAVKDKVETPGTEGARILLTSSVQDGWVFLSVEDNGSGVPEELREGLFDAFVSTRSEIEGLGLGLAISRQFMETMGGELRLVEAGRLGGARFLLKMPTPEILHTGMETAA